MFTMKARQSVPLTVSVSLDLRDAARRAAFDDNRSVSSLVARVLTDHLRDEGYLEGATRPTVERHRLF